MQLHGTGTDYGVYKATFGNMTVAITIPNEDTLPSMEQFTEALETFRSIQHRYLAKLVGSRIERPALVYELLPNGILDYHLNSQKLENSFTWKDRVTCSSTALRPSKSFTVTLNQATSSSIQTTYANSATLESPLCYIQPTMYLYSRKLHGNSWTLMPARFKQTYQLWAPYC